MMSSSSLSSPQRRNKKCKRCALSPEWCGEQYEVKKGHFIQKGEETRSMQVKYRAKKDKTLQAHLTTEQKKILLSVAFSPDGQCLLCWKCFCEFTGCSRSFLDSLKRTVRTTPWTDLFLLQKTLQNGHTGKPGKHKLKPHVLQKIKEFCDESYFFWDPRHQKICFNADVNSWERLYGAFVAVNGPNLLSSTTFRHMVKKEIFPGYQIGRQQHTKDACDVCVTYWRAKRNFLQSLHLVLQALESEQNFFFCINSGMRTFDLPTMNVTTIKQRKKKQSYLVWTGCTFLLMPCVSVIYPISPLALRLTRSTS